MLYLYVYLCECMCVREYSTGIVTFEIPIYLLRRGATQRDLQTSVKAKSVKQKQRVWTYRAVFTLSKKRGKKLNPIFNGRFKSTKNLSLAFFSWLFPFKSRALVHKNFLPKISEKTIKSAKRLFLIDATATYLRKI